MTATVKACYKITNWRTYNESLVQRGDITFWFDEDVIDAWEHDNDEPKVGRPFTYSDMAVECLLVLRELFQLPYRQTEGLGRSLVKLMQVEDRDPRLHVAGQAGRQVERFAVRRRSQRSDRRGGRQHRPEGLRRRRMEDA